MNENNINNEIKTNEDKTSTINRKDVIKNILIVFLIILLIFTLFSNTIMNKSLPEIASESCRSGKLTEQLSVSGMIESNQSYEVKVKENIVIDAINVKSGQSVSKGDVLFTINSKENPELEEAKATLKALENEYQKMLLVVPNDYASENLAIKNAREDLNNLIAQRDYLISQQGTLESLKNEYNQAKIDYQIYNEKVSTLQASISAIDTDDVFSVALEYSQELVVDYNNYSNANQTLSNFKAELETLKKKPDASETEIAELQQKIDQLTGEVNNLQNVYTDTKSFVRNNLTVDLSDAKAEATRLNGIIMNYESNTTGESSSVDSLNLEITTKQRELESLLIALQESKEKDNITDQSTNIDIQAKLDEVNNQKEKVQKLEQTSKETAIKSEYDGVVSQILISIGETTVPDSPIAIIDLSNEGYIMTASVEAEKTKKVKVGTTVNVMNDWTGEKSAELIEAKADPTNNKNRLLKFNINGDVTSGDSISLSIPLGVDNYDTLIPKSALQEDSDGKFVLVVESKSSPLGNRYYAKRVDVEVLATDNVSVAVSGMFDYSSYVITTSSAPIESGDQVKMKD